MFRTGIIFRLIDVALITLFGFIGITDIDIKSQIKLPSAQESGLRNNRQAFVYLIINNDHQFEVIDSQDQSNTFESIEKLSPYLVTLNEKHRQNSEELVLLIEPGLDSPIQWTVDVMDICEQHGIQKNLTYPQVDLP
ncbi:MAG: biopolymer transporter ExbD [candidate division KSB1 bacterium]|nr:biopolymer transporter ExbD [candidate division KSB1 bacterium]MDZ7318748.1 biopolymer transporter ExbD [candidate division KSB1 bacterium]MDZ7340800.1 biopolymer transporter ExbD [candidate division KSB1 bacterium]